MNLGYKCKLREKVFEVPCAPLLYHSSDGRNIPANKFGNPYIGLEHLRESISTGFPVSDNPEQGMTRWQERCLHDLRRVLWSMVIKFLLFRRGLARDWSFVFARMVVDGGICVGHWRKAISDRPQTRAEVSCA